MRGPTKLILRCRLSPGDIVMLTGAVRDLHRHYPGQFLTDVRTSARDLWAHNPYITPLREDDPECHILDCEYPLINVANREPVHCLHGFVAFLNDRLNLRIRPTEFKGDIHLSPAERSWHSQVREITGDEVPFWIVCAGGKFDVTIKWWSTERYQAVIDAHQDKILFAQVGHTGHWHPHLENALDLRGMTTIRQLVRLVHHAEGVLCGVTFLMHLAAATPRRPDQTGRRPCVVVAGGREPPHWEAYPGHQFIHTIGALDCCANEGCWKARTLPLHDRDPRDAPGKLCVDVRNKLPRCMDLISAKEVSDRIALYSNRTGIRKLSQSQMESSRQAITAMPKNRFDAVALTPSSAAIAIDQQLKKLPRSPSSLRGTGIICCAGTEHYFHNALKSLRQLRNTNTQIHIELWVGDSYSISESAGNQLKELEVHVVKTDPSHAPGSDWRLKAYALYYSRLRHVLLLDADSVAISDPEVVFDQNPYHYEGATAWRDVVNLGAGASVWKWFGLTAKDHPLLDAGQLAIDRQRHWQSVEFIRWLAEQASFFDDYLGGSGCFSFALWKTIPRFSPIHTQSKHENGVLRHEGENGTPLFEHRSGQRDYCSPPRFEFQNEARGKSTPHPTEMSIYQGFVQHHPLDQGTQRRNRLAALSRARMQKEDDWHVCEIDYENLPRLFRDGGRRLPFVKDVIQVMLDNIPDEGIIVITNTDVCLSPHAPQHIRKTLKATEACYSSRRDFDRLDELLDKRAIRQGNRFSGVDLIAFTRSWWMDQVDLYPDLLLGTEAWDWCFRVLIQSRARNRGRGFDDLVYHEKHHSFWFRDDNLSTLPSQQWNRSLAKTFLQQMDEWPEGYPW